MAESRARLRRAAHVLLALFGTLPGALLGCTAFVRFSPLPLDDAFAIGFLVALPLWVTAMYAAFLTRDVRRVLAACLVATAAFGALVSFGG